MELRETAILTGHTYKDLLSRNMRSRLLGRIEEIRLITCPEIPQHWSLWRISACQTCWKAFDISSVPAREVTDISETLAGSFVGYISQKISSRKKWPETVLEVRKRDGTLKVINNPINYNFLKILLT